MGRIKDFLNGFHKLEYDVELPGKPDQVLVPVDCLAEVARAAESIPVLNLNFKILDVTISKSDESPYSPARLSKNEGKTDYFVKLSKMLYSRKAIKHTEFTVNCISNFLAIDNQWWTIYVQVLLSCGTFNTVFDDAIADIALMLANGIVTSMKINDIMVKSKSTPVIFPHVNDILDRESVYTEGYVKTYSSTNHPFGIPKAVPDYLRSDAVITFDNIFTAVLLDDEEDGVNGVYKVIRKDK